MFGQIFIIIAGVYLSVSGFSSEDYIDMVLGLGVAIASFLRLYYLATGKTTLFNSPDNSSADNT